MPGAAPNEDRVAEKPVIEVAKRIMAIGATVTAITPTRRAVLTEGPSDAVLLPALLREAIQASDLGYQLVPGLASVTPGEAKELDLEAPRVAYLVDDDEGGKARRRFLLDAGISTGRVVSLAGGGTGMAVEDLVDAAVYLRAVNDELAVWGHPPFPDTELPATGRGRAIEHWCQRLGFGAPSKIRVASRILEQTYGDRPISAKRRATTRRALHERLNAALDSGAALATTRLEASLAP